MLEGKGRFQKVNNNTIRYIIGNFEGIKLFIQFIHGKKEHLKMNRKIN